MNKEKVFKDMKEREYLYIRIVKENKQTFEILNKNFNEYKQTIFSGIACNNSYIKQKI